MPRSVCGEQQVKELPSVSLPSSLFSKFQLIWLEEEEPNNSAIELGASLKAKMDSAIVELLIDNIISAVATEASLLTGVRDAIEDIQHELTRMRSILIYHYYAIKKKTI